MTTRVWSARRLLLTMSSQSASTFANQMVAFVIPWLVLSRTGSALNAGGVAFATGIASVFGTLFGGVIVDRIGGRRTAIVADALSLVTVLALVVALVADFVPLWLIVVTQVLGVLFDGPGMVARDALLPRVAREDDVPLVRATSLQETLQNTAQFVGPLSTLIFPAWFNFARESAGALGLFLGVQALGGVLGGLVFAAVGPKVSQFWWFVSTEVVATALLAALLGTEPGSAAAVALSFGVGLVGAGSLPIINTAYYSRTPEELLGRVNGTSFAMVLTVLPFSSLAFGWLINATAPEAAITMVVALNAVMVAAFALIPAMRLVDAADR